MECECSASSSRGTVHCTGSLNTLTHTPTHSFLPSLWCVNQVYLALAANQPSLSAVPPLGLHNLCLSCIPALHPNNLPSVPISPPGLQGSCELSWKGSLAAPNNAVGVVLFSPARHAAGPAVALRRDSTLRSSSSVRDSPIEFWLCS